MKLLYYYEIDFFLILMECWDINLFFVSVIFFSLRGKVTQQTLFWFKFSEIDCCFFFVSDVIYVKFEMSGFLLLKMHNMHHGVVIH